MLIATIVLFIIAALFGAFILSAILKNKSTPKPIVLIHGSIAGLTLLVLIAYVASGHTNPLLITSLVLFIAAVGGGLTMLTYDMRNKAIPKVIALLHPLIAVIGLVLLIVYAFQTLS